MNYIRFFKGVSNHYLFGDLAFLQLIVLVYREKGRKSYS